MKKRILSIVSSMAVLCCMLVVSAGTVVEAAEQEPIMVDGSYLTTEDSSTGKSSDGLTRGKHMMTGECSISKAGVGRIYCFGATTANHDVDYLAVIVYVDQYNEETGEWWQIDAWAEEIEDDFFVYTSKSIEVDRGYYYRVHADHFVREGDDPPEETFSTTNGIFIP